MTLPIQGLVNKAQGPLNLTNRSTDNEKISEAVHALFQYIKKTSSKKLLDEEQNIGLQFSVKKIARLPSNHLIIKIPLPTPLLPETSDVCLFVKDLDKKERDYTPTVRHYQELLESKGINNITEIIPLKSIKTEYKPFELKKNLANRFTVFLADSRIMRLLPELLGKHFYGRRRIPIQVDMERSDLKAEFDKVLSITQCIMSAKGGTARVLVGSKTMTEEEVVANIMVSVDKLAHCIPGGFNNIRSINLNTRTSPSLPVYVSLGSGDDVVLPDLVKKVELDEPEEISTMEHGKVRVTPWGTVEIFYSSDEEEEQFESESEGEESNVQDEIKSETVDKDLPDEESCESNNESDDTESEYESAESAEESETEVIEPKPKVRKGDNAISTTKLLNLSKKSVDKNTGNEAKKALKNLPKLSANETLEDMATTGSKSKKNVTKESAEKASKVHTARKRKLAKM